MQARRLPVVLAVIGVLAGCNRGMMTPASLGRQNQNRSLNLVMGMTKQDALKVMGTEPVEVATGPVARETILNPYSTEAFRASNGDLIEIVYYASSEGSRIPLQQLRLNAMPLVFRNNVLIGWGDGALDTVKGGHSGEVPPRR